MNDISSVLSNEVPFYLSDGGLETWLIFQRGFELREFASFELLHSQQGKEALDEYFTQFLDLANKHAKGFILDTPTWRANPDWCQKLGFNIREMEAINITATSFIRDIRSQGNSKNPILINGVIGPRGDGYAVEEQMEADEAKHYHSRQISALKKGGAEMVTGVTMTNTQEAIGIANSAKNLDAPCVISFTVETDGRLPSGQLLGDAINELDIASDNYPLYFMINCAHPDHFRGALNNNDSWINRIGGVRANASRMSHAELDVAEELDDGNPTEFGTLHAELVENLPSIRVLGGCCGTDVRHISCVAEHLTS